ncbi:hypothetical protein LAV72_18510 [Lysinibacillus xylanilyticus]|uniref:hypothetical protein n=1 Tax=Lysinibacillus xylanilyticus TaxID=582475 RepID=UPI002B24201F|nr:hypothetical protein [Lysinibacillus xylanilyticus]MEB2301599.1 hypothetical protein [Lysinibacillus xylanilyticus]
MNDKPLLNDSTEGIDWPDWGKFRIDVIIDGDQICIQVSYETQQGKFCAKVEDSCASTSSVKLFDVGGFKVYLRSVEICYTSKDKYAKGQVWVEKSPFKTKLGEFTFEL